MKLYIGKAFVHNIFLIKKNVKYLSSLYIFGKVYVVVPSIVVKTVFVAVVAVF